MKQEDFLESFQEALIGNVPERVVQENVNYYRNYINKQIMSGNTEDSILQSLGNPRLLAKTIIDTNQYVTQSNDSFEQDSWRQDYSDRYQWRNPKQNEEQIKQTKMKTLQIPGWLSGILCVVAMALLIGLAFCVVSHLAPILLVVGIGVIGYKAVRKWIKGY